MFGYHVFAFAGAGDISADSWSGRNLHFGVREHAMASILNGLSLSKIRPFGSGFLIFSDYSKPALRLSALMEIPVIQVFTHDSIGVGEDGPTHQPVEQLASLRSIPGLVTLRPADANEVVEAWRVIMQLRHEPAALVLTRQHLPTLDRSRFAAASGLANGAYVLADTGDGQPDLLLLASRWNRPRRSAGSAIRAGARRCARRRRQVIDVGRDRRGSRRVRAES
jgi:transketolase